MIAQSLHTKQDIVDRLVSLEDARKDWSEILPVHDPDKPKAIVNPNIFDVHGTRSVTANIVDAVKELAEFAETNDFEPAAYELVLGVDELVDAWAEWADEISHTTPGDYGYLARPDAPKCWAVLARVMKLIPEPRFPTPEPIERLIAEPGIRHNQIAEIYGWHREDGSPDADKVKEEMQMPGKHYKPSEWISPEVGRRIKKFAAKWESRKRKRVNIAAPGDKQARKKRWADPPPAPEPIEQLLRMEGMTAQQVAVMKKITLEEVYEAAHKCGIALDHSAASAMYPELGEEPLNRFKPLSDLQKKIDARLDAEVKHLRQENRDDMNLPERVAELLQDNPDLDAGTILRVVQRRYPTATFEIIDELCKSFAMFEDGEYEPESQELPIPDPDLSDDKPLNNQNPVVDHLKSMNRKQLEATARELGIDYSRVRNDALRSLIQGKIVEKAAATA